MPADVAILHGWSDTAQSFTSLRDFLARNKFNAQRILLADYISLDDDVRIEDVAARMDIAVNEAIRNRRLTPPFDMIVHSTGGLVAREWISRFYPDAANCPVKRLVMLAPANFGSRLASTGKSMLGRVIKGWNNWFQTGTQTLNGLELASEYQWDLALRDLLDPSGESAGPYGPDKIMPFVVIGTKGYEDVLREIVNENGSDGTIRCAAANLNVRGFTVDFSHSEKDTEVVPVPWHVRAGDVLFPFAILPDRDHSSIIKPDEQSGANEDISDRLGKLILQALKCNGKAEYAAIAEDWRKISEATAASTPEQLGKTMPDDTNALHQYLQIVIYVRDDQGQAINDYFVEYFSPNQRGSKESIIFHRDVLDHVHVNGLSPSRRCFFIDRTDLMFKYYEAITKEDNKVVSISLSASDPGENIRYFDNQKVGAAGHLTVHRASDDRQEVLGAHCLIRNTTHFVEIIIPRRGIDKVFKI